MGVRGEKMNKNVSRFFHKCIEPRSQYIVDRASVLDLNIPEAIPHYLASRFEDIKIMYMLGMDSTIMKVIPIFLEDILINIAVAVKAKFKEEIPKHYKKFESKYGWEILDLLNNEGVLSERDYLFCKRYYSDNEGTGKGLRIRKLEVHNKEFQKFNEKTLVGMDPYGNTHYVEPNLKKALEQTPEFFRAININDTIIQSLGEIIGIYNILVNYANLLSRLNNLPTQSEYELLGSMPRGINFVAKYPKGKSKSLNAIHKAFEGIPIVTTFQIKEEENEFIVVFQLKEEMDTLTLLVQISQYCGDFSSIELQEKNS